MLCECSEVALPLLCLRLLRVALRVLEVTSGSIGGCFEGTLSLLSDCCLPALRLLRLLLDCPQVALRLVSNCSQVAPSSQIALRLLSGCCQVALRWLSCRLKLLSGCSLVAFSLLSACFQVFLNLLSGCSGSARRLFPCNFSEIARRLLLCCAPIAFMFKDDGMLL